MVNQGFGLIEIMGNIALNIFCSFELVLAHFLFFQKQIDFFSANSLIIFLQSFFFYGVLFSVGRKTVISFAVLANILIVLLLVYHRVYQDPIPLKMISLQYNEGLLYLKRAAEVFLSPAVIGAVLYLALIIFFIITFYKRLQNPWLYRIIYVVPLAAVMGISYANYHHELFFKHHFQHITEIFGYPQGWAYELVTNSDIGRQVDYVVKMANEKPHPLPPELEKMQAHKHIYIIQLESFQYFAFEKEINGQKVMPYLNGIKEESALYQILPKRPHPSANSDFAVLGGINDIMGFYYVLYQIISPEELYARITPITWKYKEHGYYLSFYHGFVETFYNRGPHIKAMKFDDIYFLTELRKNYQYHEGEWGVNDMDVAKLIVENQKQNPQDKSFTFFITVSTHDPFDIGAVETKVFPEPKNILERYYNSFNYVDQMLEYLIKNAPEDSLFIMYSDHPSLETEPEDTFFMVYSNKQKFKNFAKVDFKQTMQIIKSVLHKNLTSDN